jgi:hypothetical protein
MPEHTVRLRKRSGGSGLTHNHIHYEWPENGSVTEVPYDLAMRLLAVQDGDFSVAGEAAPARGLTSVNPGSVRSARDAGLSGSEEGAEGEDGTEGDEAREVTEPAPAGVHVVTEPAPRAGQEAAEGSQAPESGAGSKITPRPTAGTRRPAPRTARGTPARRGAAARK